MAKDIPYLASIKNLSSILDKIKVAQTPPKFTYEFLKSNLGFPSSSDRGVIQVLKALGFLSDDSTPTARYNEFRATNTSRKAMAAGLREGWSDIFLSDQFAYTRTPTELKSTFKNVTGKSEAVSEKMATTFKALADMADFSVSEPIIVPANEVKSTIVESERIPESMPRGSLSLRNDIHIHLPPTTDVAVYSAIFKALREELLD